MLLKLVAAAAAVVIAVVAWPGGEESPGDSGTSTDERSGEPAMVLRSEGSPAGGDVSAVETHDEPEISGRFSAISLAGSNGCGLRTDGSMLCWEFDLDRLRWASERSGEFTDVSAARWQDCAVRADETITCWWQPGGQTFERYETAHVTDGQFTDVSTGRNHVCALRTDGTVVCWGSTLSGEVEGPAGRFTGLGGQRPHELRHRGRDGIPHQLGIHVVVLVHEEVAHTAGADNGQGRVRGHELV